MNINRADKYVDGIEVGGAGRYLSGAMEEALKMKSANQIFVMFNGKPDIGIRNLEELRRLVRKRNTRHIKINILALGTGEKFVGTMPLKSLAEENNGRFDYVNLAK